MNKHFKKVPWKVEHRSDGLSFMAIPYNDKETFKHYWVIGPLDKEVVDWLDEAVKEYQTKEQNHNCKSWGRDPELG